MSKEYCKTVITTCKHEGSNSSQTASKKDVADTKRKISELSSTLTEIKVCIAVFSGKPQGTNSIESNIGQEAPISRTQAIILEDAPPSAPILDLQAP